MAPQRPRVSGALSPSGKRQDPGSVGDEGLSFVATKPWGLDDQSDGGDGSHDEEAMHNFDEGAGPSIKKAINRHNNAIQHAVRKYGEFLTTIMLDRMDLWADGNAEGQREVAERNGNKLVYI